MPRTTDYGRRTLAAAILLGAGAVLCARLQPLYSFAWSHPIVMLLGQFVLLTVGAYTRAWMLAPFWVLSGVTAYAMVFRAAEELGGGLAAAVVSVAAVAVAYFAARTLRGVEQIG